MEATSDSYSVIKRDGTKQPYEKAKVHNRLKTLAYGLNEEYVTYDEVVDKVSNGLFDGKFTQFLRKCTNFCQL
jgi:transcriptional regulator NrdR family protein